MVLQKYPKTQERIGKNKFHHLMIKFTKDKYNIEKDDMVLLHGDRTLQNTNNSYTPIEISVNGEE